MSFFELPEEDRPPEHIWLDSDEVDKHFKQVEENRKHRAAGTSAVPEAGEEYEPVENEYATALLRK